MALRPSAADLMRFRTSLQAKVARGSTASSDDILPRYPESNLLRRQWMSMNLISLRARNVKEILFDRSTAGEKERLWTDLHGEKPILACKDKGSRTLHQLPSPLFAYTVLLPLVKKSSILFCIQDTATKLTHRC